MQNDILDKLFREEFTKMVAVIAHSFGLQHIEQAEDIVSDTFVSATQHWGLHGLPPNPVAWLYHVAKQKAIQYFRRTAIYEQKVLPGLKTGAATETAEELQFSSGNIKDSQLGMLFAVCHPAIASEAQVALALRILCGLRTEEIADKFHTSTETITKRLQRAKERLRTEQIKAELPPEGELAHRLDNVLHIIYLLFSEGYYSSSHQSVLREDLCREAIALALLLADNTSTAQSKTYALLALMCFHTSRLRARSATGDYPNIYDAQDASLWDADLIERGKFFLGKSATGNALSSYHLEAGIAFLHCDKDESTAKWEAILQHYNLLLQINYAPSAALSRTYALYKARGAAHALPEAEKLNLPDNHFYHLLLGELYQEMDDARAAASFETARSLAKTEAEKAYISRKITALRNW